MRWAGWMFYFLKGGSATSRDERLQDKYHRIKGPFSWATIERELMCWRTSSTRNNTVLLSCSSIGLEVREDLRRRRLRDFLNNSCLVWIGPYIWFAEYLDPLISETRSYHFLVSVISKCLTQLLGTIAFNGYASKFVWCSKTIFIISSTKFILLV